MGHDDDDDEESFGGLYEDGHWVWDDSVGALIFVSDRPAIVTDAIPLPIKAPTGTIEFRDDIDLIEQLRFRKRYMRKLKPGEPDVITVQDVKDLAIYTAPLTLMSPMLIDMLHLSTTERFIRALIFYCQYYLQTTDIMGFRMLELETKVRTPQSEEVERVFRENLSDLRTLVAKEYCTMIIGGADTKKFHHMGAQKKRKSLSDKDARLFETLLRMCIQIVWLALGRRSFNQLELEVNRLFKSDIFNSVEHMKPSNSKMTKEERDVLLGCCLRHDQKLNTRSPLMNEVFCARPIDYRMMGLGVIKYEMLHRRLLYMWLAIAGPEEELVKIGVPCGILGYPRPYFDTMLCVLPTVASDKSKSKAGGSKQSVQSDKSRSRSSSGSQTAPPQSSLAFGKSRLSTSEGSGGNRYLYTDIVLPEVETLSQQIPTSFPDEPEVERRCSEKQRRQWQNRLQRLINPSAIRHNK
ncbi:protein phosphatase 1 regulatory subunit 36-like [Hyposmocoma kahamanoa]|uniref:protein phosphatase 1 regulatory subunit 36-like n=1 Tax=Hyposmocoma kahamanoa TaxID=1477025 RepID=UPI000E6D8863|nr:protein phosphatase 1 regulatory subunit 36-like [Hyposmocoma kahamanoa]